MAGPVPCPHPPDSAAGSPALGIQRVSRPRPTSNPLASCGLPALSSLALTASGPAPEPLPVAREMGKPERAPSFETPGRKEIGLQRVSRR